MLIALIIILIILLIALFFYILIGYKVVKSLMLPTKRDNVRLLEYETKEKGFQKEWLDIPHEIVKLESDYGYTLSGRIFINPNKTDKFLISLHGHNSSSLSQFKYLNMFLDEGYNVFIPDHRFSGDSGGKSITFGYFEKFDVLKWLDFLNNRYPNSTFGIFGESMGAATAIMVTAMDKRIRFLIEYCGYANFELLSSPHYGKEIPTIVKYCFGAVGIVARVLTGAKISDIDAAKYMRQITVPTIIIHSKGDKLIDISNAYALQESNPNAAIKIFEASAHARSMVKYPKEFRETVSSFLKTNQL